MDTVAGSNERSKLSVLDANHPPLNSIKTGGFCNSTLPQRRAMLRAGGVLPRTPSTETGLLWRGQELGLAESGLVDASRKECRLVLGSSSGRFTPSPKIWFLCTPTGVSWA